MVEEDAGLVARYVAGEAGAVAQVDAWLSRAASPFRGGLGNDFADVLQEVRLEVYRLLEAGRFRGEARLKTYLWRVCAHTCLDHLRRLRRRPQHEPEPAAEPLPSLDPSPLDAVLAGERHGRLLAALESVSGECRALWGLIVEGLAYREIALRLGVSEGALRVRAHRCRKRAVEILTGNGSTGS